MKPSIFSQKKFAFKDAQSILAATLLGLVLVVGLVTLNWWIAGQYGAGADFLPAWNGARAFALENADPYSQTVAEQTQKEVYGRAARAGEYPYALDIPFPLHILFFPPLLILQFLSQFIPFVTVTDVTWVRAVWMTLSELGLLLLATFSLRLADWRPKSWFNFLLLAFALTWFYSVAALLNASMSVLLTLALVGALVAMRDFKDESAGFLLAIAAMKWEVTILLWLFIVIGAYSAKRWRVFAGLGMTWFVLGALGFLFYPNWIWPYLRSVTANLRADIILTPALFLQKWIPTFGARLAQVVIAVLLVILIIEWFSALRGKDFRRVAWVAALALAVTPLIGFSTTFANLAPLVFSFAFILPFAWERWEKRPYLVISLITFIFFAFPLFLRWPTIASRIPADGLAFLLPPVLTILGLYWIRWYVVRPPRTWLDEAKRELRK
jgi:hypothetical protein